MIAPGQGDFNKYLIPAILCFATHSYEEQEYFSRFDLFVKN